MTQMVWSLCLFPLFFHAAIAAAPAVDNGATHYRRAFDAVPASEADLKVYENWNDTAWSPEVVALVKRLEPVMDELHQGSTAQSTDWKWDYSKGMDLQLPECGKARTLSNAALLFIRHRMEQEQWSQGVQTANDLMILGPRLGQSKAIVARLVGYGVEQQGVLILGAYLPALPAQERRRVRDNFVALPKLPLPSETFRGEEEMVLASVRNSGREGTALYGQVPQDAAEQSQLMRQVQELWEEGAKIAAMRPDQANAAAIALNEKVAAAPPVIRDKLRPPRPERLAFVDTIAREKDAMFVAAIAVLDRGPATLASSKDPYGPFTYKKLDDGFELTCRLMNQGKPVHLVIGKAALLD